MRASIATLYLLPIRLEHGPTRDPEVTYALERSMRPELETVYYTNLLRDDKESIERMGYIVEDWSQLEVPE